MWISVFRREYRESLLPRRLLRKRRLPRHPQQRRPLLKSLLPLLPRAQLPGRLRLRSLQPPLPRNPHLPRRKRMKADLKFFEEKEKVIIADLATYGRQSGILSFMRLISFICSVALAIWGYASHKETPRDGGAWWAAVDGVAQSWTRLKRLSSSTMGCRLPGSSVHGIHQARILEWVVILFSRGSSQPRGQTCVYHISGRFFSI